MTQSTVAILNFAINAALALAVGFAGAHIVRFVVRRAAPDQNASFGAFCFMLAALGINGGLDEQSSRFAADAGRAVGQLAALPLIWWWWFRREPRRAVAQEDLDA